MTKVIKLTRGFDIKIEGAPAKKINNTFTSKTFSIKPIDFHGLAPIPKLLVAEGDGVLAGDRLFFDKQNDNIFYTAPVSGEVIEIRRGEKRSIVEIVILADQVMKYRQWDKADVNSISNTEIIDRMLDSGAWHFLKQRPYDIAANPKEEPKAIFISGFDSAPLAPDYNFIMEGKQFDFQNGIKILSKLTKGKIHLCLSSDHKPCDTFDYAKGVEVHWFSGPHPAGNAGIQIHHIDPINKGDTIWYINPQDVANLGKLFTEGIYQPERTVAYAGPELVHTGYIKTLQGANISEIIKNNLKNTHVRFISGNVLTGKKIEANGHLGYYDHLLTVIEEGDQPELFGWLIPAYPRPTKSSAFLAYMNEAPSGFRVNTGMHGEERAYVVTGQYESVLPMDIYPVNLVKAIMARDFDLMEGLGIYEVSEEDFALCEFVCTSKIEVQEIIREGLDYVRSQN